MAIDGEFRVLEINDLAGLEPYRFIWRGLFADTRQAGFFQTFEWFACYWRHYGATQRMRVLVIFRGDTVVAVVPLVVRKEETKAGVVRVLTYPLHDWGSFYGPIGPQPTAALLMTFRHLGMTERDWDVLDLRWIDQDGSDHGRTESSMTLAGMSPASSTWKETALVEFHRDGWETYWAARKSHWRTNCRRNERRLEELGEVRIVRYRPNGSGTGDDDPRWYLFDQCIELAKRSWQADSANGTTLSHEQIVDFLRDAHAEAVRLGMVDICLLEVDGHPVAFAYNYHHAGYVFGLRMGHDADEKYEGAGSVLMMHMLRDSAQRGDKTIDLGPEYLEAKRNWVTRIAKIGRATHYPPSALRVQLLRLKRWWDRRRMKVA
jgi:CelD/BcsL family acetyltransferase involved in cellulose biosynthesis